MKQMQIFKEQQILNGSVLRFEFWFVSDFAIPIFHVADIHADRATAPEYKLGT